MVVSGIKVGVMVAVGLLALVGVAVAGLVAVGLLVLVAMAVAGLVAVGLLALFVVAVAVGVRPDSTRKFPLGAEAMRANVLRLAASSRMTNKKMTRNQRLALLFLCGSGCIFSVVGVIIGTSGSLHN